MTTEFVSTTETSDEDRIYHCIKSSNNIFNTIYFFASGFDFQQSNILAAEPRRSQKVSFITGQKCVTQRVSGDEQQPPRNTQIISWLLCVLGKKKPHALLLCVISSYNVDLVSSGGEKLQPVSVSVSPREMKRGKSRRHVGLISSSGTVQIILSLLCIMNTNNQPTTRTTIVQFISFTFQLMIQMLCKRDGRKMRKKCVVLFHSTSLTCGALIKLKR